MCDIRTIEKDNDQILICVENRRKPFVNFLERYYRLAEEHCKKLELGSDVCEVTKVFSESFHNYSTCSRKPSGIVGASIVLACEKLGINLPKRKVAIALGVSEMCLKRSYDSIQTCLKKRASEKLRRL